ncbi:hypothetical protein BD749_2666 [Pontibacter ramchanderi]|uniref:Uncharacterized protein n=1 Tax=Pontibacter ramchanderi TaxID=1179743 RepID=A0A2N3U7W8_9BACT|nr:hypothetical protein BD749_2666 [Pontibacter ramchanderi]
MPYIENLFLFNYSLYTIRTYHALLLRLQRGGTGKMDRSRCFSGPETARQPRPVRM